MKIKKLKFCLFGGKNICLAQDDFRKKKKLEGRDG